MHKTLRKPSPWLLLLVVLAMVAAACAPGDDVAEPEDPDVDDVDEPAEEPEDEPEVTEGGTLIFGHEQEPAILNSTLTEGNLAATSLTTNTILYGAYEVTPDFQYVPQLIDGEAETTEDPFTVTYNIREEAEWSDGTPITAADFEFTYETIMNEEFDITSRNGYDQITEVEIVDDKTITFTFEDTFGPYRTLFSTSKVLPAHVLEGEDFNTVWDDAIIDPATDEPIGSGPFLFESWDRGQQLTVARNENFWGEAPSLDQIVFRYIEETPTLIQQIRGGEINAFDPQPQVDMLPQFEGIDGVEVQQDAGPVWEHIDFNFDNPLLAERYVREAFVLGLDRTAIVDSFREGMYAELEVLDNTIYVNNQDEYEPFYDRYEHDPDAARQVLEENGCTEGDDGIFECNGERLEFGYVSVAGNERRELMFEIVQAQMADIGIQLNAEFSEAADSLGTRLPAGDFDIINFGWVGSPDPFGGNTIWQCDGALNYNNYCNEEVTELIAETDRLIDADERADTYNQAAELIAEDIPLIPIIQMPETLVYEDHVMNLRVNATQWGPTWNAQEWALAQ